MRLDDKLSVSITPKGWRAIACIQALADADEISARIVAGRYRATISDVETLRNHVRKLAAAIAELEPAPPPGRESIGRSHSGEGNNDIG